MTYPVKIYWKNRDTVSTWNEPYITLIETFGLPGNQNYTTNLTENYLQVNFVNEQDAIRAMLLLL